MCCELEWVWMDGLSWRTYERGEDVMGKRFGSKGSGLLWRTWKGAIKGGIFDEGAEVKGMGE